MGSALFYHLTRSPADRLLPQLIAKARAAGWRIELRGADPRRLDQIDDQLWQAEGFIAHGRAGGPHDARQPILLTLGGRDDDNPAARTAPCLIALDGAPVPAGDAAHRERVLILFDGNDPAALDQARGQWRDLTAAGIAAEYWSEASGRWERKR